MPALLVEIVPQDRLISESMQNKISVFEIHILRLGVFLDYMQVPALNPRKASNCKLSKMDLVGEVLGMRLYASIAMSLINLH